MDRNLFNFKNIAIVAVFSIIAFLGFNSFTVANSEIVKRETVTKQAWYPLDLTSSTSLTVQEIDGTPIPTLDEEGACQDNFTGDYCAVRLSFEVDEADPTPTIPNGTTVQDAIDFYGATVVLDGSSQRIYAQHDIER